MELSDMYTLVILPLLIFTARVLDVTLGTLRIMFISKGLKIFAASVAFFEMLIWIVAIVKILEDLTNFVNYIAFAGGFAAGTYAGIWVENRLAVGLMSLWIVTEEDARELIHYLRSKRYVFTTGGASGPRGNVRVVFAIVRRRDMHEVVLTIRRFNPGAFVSTAEAKSIDLLSIKASQKKPLFSPTRSRRARIHRIRSWRKGK